MVTYITTVIFIYLYILVELNTYFLIQFKIVLHYGVRKHDTSDTTWTYIRGLRDD